MTVESIDQRRIDDKNYKELASQKKSKPKRLRRDYSHSPPPHCSVVSRVYLRSSVLLSPHMQVWRKILPASSLEPSTFYRRKSFNCKLQMMSTRAANFCFLLPKSWLMVEVHDATMFCSAT